MQSAAQQMMHWGHDATITGFSGAWLIYKYFRIEDQMCQVYGFYGLTDIMWYSDERLQEFRARLGVH